MYIKKHIHDLLKNYTDIIDFMIDDRPMTEFVEMSLDNSKHIKFNIYKLDDYTWKFKIIPQDVKIYLEDVNDIQKLTFKHNINIKDSDSENVYVYHKEWNDISVDEERYVILPGKVIKHEATKKDGYVELTLYFEKPDEKESKRQKTIILE